MKLLKILLAIIAFCGFLLIVTAEGGDKSDMLCFGDSVIRGLIGLVTVLCCCGMLCLMEVRNVG